MLDLPSFRSAYASFLRPGRILLTGHSHQAWPDVARGAMTDYFDDSARWVDDKWSQGIFPCIERVAPRILDRMGFHPSDALAFGRSTHELVFRLLTCLPPRPRIVTTRSEFHSLHRQLSRLAEEGAEVVWVDGQPRDTLAERLCHAIDDRTALVAVSAVFFEDACIQTDLGAVMARAVEKGAIPLVDAYHAFNVAPLDWGPAREHLFVTAGGYKYAQFGEGICWLRVPSGCSLRPVYTGWFADFEALGDKRAHPVSYGSGGDRFAGATFDATAFYRARAVLDHLDRFGLDVPALRAISTRQTSLLVDLLDRANLLGDSLSLVSPRDPARRAGFVSLRTPQAAQIVAALRDRGVLVDAREDILRLGPAPYLSDDELEEGVTKLARVVRPDP